MDPRLSPQPFPPPPPPPPPPLLQMQSQNPSGNAENATHFTSEPNPDDTPKHRQRQNRAMANFRALVMKIAASDPTRPLTATWMSIIEKRLSEFFRDTHTPDHPTYAAMIYRAILELNEEGGSSEESISKFIKNVYEDLPWAHTTLLRHHLWKLCESGEIVVSCEQCYLLGDAITKLRPDQTTGASPMGEQMMIKQSKERGRGRGRPRKKHVIKEENQLTEDETEMIDVEIQVTGERNKVIEEQNLLTELRDDVFKELNQAKEGKDEVMIEQNEVEVEENEANKEQNRAEFQDDAVDSESQEQENGGSDEWNQPQKQETGIREEQKQPEEEQNDETEGQQIDVIEVQNQPLEQQSGDITKQDKRWEQEIKEPSQQLEQQNEVIEEQNQVERQYGRVRGETLQFCSKGENDVDDGLRDLPIESPGKMDKEKAEGQRRRSPSREGESIDICGLRIQQQPELPHPERSPESKPMEGLSGSHDHQQQQEQEKPQHMQLLIRFRLTKPEPAIITTMVESLPLENQHEKQQEPDCSGLGRPAETVLDIPVTIGESSTADQQHQDEQLQQPVRRGRGRPPKVKPEAAATTGLLLHPIYQHNPQRKGRGRPPKVKPEAAATTGLLLHPIYQHKPQQKEHSKHRGRGRPPKCKSSAGTNVENSQKQQQPKRQGRGRPRKLNSEIQGQQP